MLQEQIDELGNQKGVQTREIVKVQREYDIYIRTVGMSCNYLRVKR